MLTWSPVPSLDVNVSQMLKRLIKTTYKHRTTVLLEREWGLGIIVPSDELEKESLDSDFL